MKLYAALIIAIVATTAVTEIMAGPLNEQPTTEAPKPTSDAPKPTTQAPKPTSGAPKPTTEAPKPTTEAPKPTSDAPKPTSDAPKPTNAPTPTPKTGGASTNGVGASVLALTACLVTKYLF